MENPVVIDHLGRSDSVTALSKEEVFIVVMSRFVIKLYNNPSQSVVTSVWPGQGLRTTSRPRFAAQAVSSTMNCILGDKPTEVSRTDRELRPSSDLKYGDQKITAA